MALMASSRREAGTKSFPLVIYVVVPLLALGLQSLLSLHFSRFDLVDLPLLVTIYYAITQREPVSGTLVGALIGIAQDAPDASRARHFRDFKGGSGLHGGVAGRTRGYG